MVASDASAPSTRADLGVQGIQRDGVLPDVEMFPLGKLDMDPARFQVRNHLENTFIKQLGVTSDEEGLLQHLLAVVKRGLHLDPLLVWQDPADTKGRLVVIDGHHRMEAYAQAFKRKAGHLVPIQRLMLCTTETQARAMAMAINARQHLNMTPAEIKGALFSAMVMDEVTGSVRALEAQWGISRSTISRMQSKAREVHESLLAQLRAQAHGFNDDPQLDWAYVKAHAPTWREVMGWKPNEENHRDEDLNELAQQKLLERFHKHFQHEAKANPDGLREVFERFLIEQSAIDQDDFEEENEDEF